MKINKRLCSSKDGPNHSSQGASAMNQKRPGNSNVDSTASTSSGGHKERKYLWTSAEAITYATTRAYGDMETAIMSRIKESNQRRFRMYFYPSVILISAVVYFFGSEFRKYLAQETAGLAKETLENENLKIQTQELATAVIQTILNDKEVTNQAAKFLQQAAGAPETQEALLKLTQYILSHPDTLKEVTKLVKQLLQELSTDKETAKQLATLLIAALAEPKVQWALSQLVSELLKDPEVVRAVEVLVVELSQKPVVLHATNELLLKSSQAVLTDNQVLSQSQEFVADVMGDDRLQREGGHALINSISHAVRPTFLRMLGVGLVITAVGLVKIVLSPF